MQIRVGTTVSQAGPRAIPSSLPGRKADLPNPVRTRYITLNEIDVDEPTWFLNLNGVHFEALPVTETRPKVGTVEDWVYVNLTGDTHPMHTHLVTFQVVGRTHVQRAGLRGGLRECQRRRGERRARWDRSDPVRDRADRASRPDRRGFKDTVKANPGYFTTIRAKYELPGGVTAPQPYVYHCHIVEHEDNDMMRPYTVTA